MFCSRCGTEVQKASQFCPSCGLDLRVTTPVQAIATGDVTELDIVREALTAEYELLEELGRGGMAIVYRARDRQLEREVAIKVLPFSLAFDGEFVERFQREARTAAQLEHPNIIPIYRVGKSGRVIYFVMKLLRGQSLSRIMFDRRRLAPADIRRFLVESANALGYAHTRGIVHRDIKPDNILLDEFGQCVVTDFGIAKAASGQKLTGTGMSIGTPHYMSPEQARAQAIDGRSDIYSLGIVAYQALVGEVPYDGEDSFSIGYKHIMEPIPTPTLSAPEERRLFEIVKRMIMKDPRDRFQDADELIRALEGQPLTGSGFSGRATAARIGITTQPTTLLPGLADDTGLVAAPRESGPRRPVGRRSVAARPPAKSRPWTWVLLLVAAAAAGYYFYTLRTAPAPSTGTAAPAPADSLSHDSTALAALDTSRRQDSLSPGGPPAALPRDSQRVAPPIIRSDTAPPLTAADSGVLRIVGLPPLSTVMVDSRQITASETKLPVGAHELAITAPRHNFYKDTVVITAGQLLSFTPELTKIGDPERPRGRRAIAALVANCEIPGPANRFGRACYDTPPAPIGPTRVPLTPDIEGTPSPVIVLVKVSSEGRTLEVKPVNQSNDAAFQKKAEAFAAQLQWKPALRAGVPVEGWTQFVLNPDR